MNPNYQGSYGYGQSNNYPPQPQQQSGYPKQQQNQQQNGYQQGNNYQQQYPQQNGYPPQPLPPQPSQQQLNNYPSQPPLPNQSYPPQPHQGGNYPSQPLPTTPNTYPQQSYPQQVPPSNYGTNQFQQPYGTQPQQQQQFDQFQQNNQGYQDPNNYGGYQNQGGNNQGFYNNQQPNYNYPQDSAATAPVSQPRIDPKQIPRPIYPNNVNEIVKFFTRSGTCPPPAASPYLVIDEGNCSPRFMRLTTSHIPSTNELVEQTHICVGAMIQPLANVLQQEENVSIVDAGPNGPLRCNRCRCYVNPFFKFIDGGKFFICNMCELKNDVPREYQCHLDANGFRRDKNDRPELSKGSVEYVATSEYITRQLNPNPCYLFVVDVSYSSVVTGLLGVLIQSISNCLDGLLSVQPNARVGLITYDSNIHFYRIMDSKGPCTPQLINVSDVASPFVPFPLSQLMAYGSNPDQRASFEGALQLVDRIFADNRKEGNAFGAACQAAADMLTGLGGKVIVVQSNLPNIGIGALKPRDDITFYGTDKEKTLLVPQIPFYDTLAGQCADNAVSFDIFACPNSYVDIATTSPLASSTGGQLFFYPGFHSRKDGETLQNDLFHVLTRTQGSDAVMTVRVSNGLRVAEFYGNYFKRVPLEMEIPHLDNDKSFAVRFVHENALKDQNEVCIQCALLYTNSYGERRIRVHSLSVPVTPTMGVIFRNTDVDTVLNLSLKQVVGQFSTNTIAQARQALLQACINILHIYRKKCASATSVGQLILPESLKLLPLYTLSILKGNLLGPTQNADERSFLTHFVNSMSNQLCIPFVFPHLYSLHDLSPEYGTYSTTDLSILPPLCPILTSEILLEGIYVLDNGRELLILVGEYADPTIIDELFDSVLEGKGEAKLTLKQFIPEDPDCLCSRVNAVLDLLRKGRPTYLPISVMRRSQTAIATQGSQRIDSAQYFMSQMFEDGYADKDKEAATATVDKLSYVAFLCYLHRKIQDKFV